jgi:hypothetical protein
MAQSRRHLFSLIGTSGQSPQAVCGKIKKKEKKEPSPAQIKLYEERAAAVLATRKTRELEEEKFRRFHRRPRGSSAARGGQHNIEVADGDGAGLGTSGIDEENGDGANAVINIDVDDGQPNIEVADVDGAGLGTSDIDEEDGDVADAVINIDVDEGYEGDAVIDIMDKHFPAQACNALGFAAQSFTVGELHSMVTHLARRQRERLICAVLRILDARIEEMQTATPPVIHTDYVAFDLLRALGKLMREAKRERFSLIQALNGKAVGEIAKAGGFHKVAQPALVPHDEDSRSLEHFQTHVLKEYEHWYTADMHLLSTPGSDDIFAHVVERRHIQRQRDIEKQRLREIERQRLKDISKTSGHVNSTGGGGSSDGSSGGSCPNMKQSKASKRKLPKNHTFVSKAGHAGLSPLDTVSGLVCACYFIDNYFALMSSPASSFKHEYEHQHVRNECRGQMGPARSKWLAWRKQKVSGAVENHVLQEHLREALVCSHVDVRIRDVSIVDEARGIYDVTLADFLTEQGLLFLPYSIVFAKYEQGACDELPGEQPRGFNRVDKLRASVVSDGSHFAIYLGLTERRIATSTFMYAQGKAVTTLQTGIKAFRNTRGAETTDYVVLWHAIARLGWGVGTCAKGEKALLGASSGA